MNLKMKNQVIVVGGGLAGTEAANQITKFGIKVVLYEMRPNVTTPAHQTDSLGELVCSNSLKSSSISNASGVLKKEMEFLGSLIIESANHCSVPAGKALAVDRNKFSNYISKKISENKLIDLVRSEFTKLSIDNSTPIVIATGPLTSEKLSENIVELTESDNLYFYDSISPIIDSDSLDYSKIFKASRYDTGSNEEGDYLNCPLNEEQYYNLVNEIIAGNKIDLHEFEKPLYFESCLPIEVMCERGKDTLRFGPLKPVGLKNPKTGREHFGIIQLRQENTDASMYNMVGFQTKLTYPEQRRIFRMIPGLENAEFLRYGSIHRNTYINSPKVLNKFLQLKKNKNIFFAGQITGVEGYVESAATGIIAGINAARMLTGNDLILPPRETALGSLINYINEAESKNFQPMNINFGLFPNLNKKMKKTERRELQAKNALESISKFTPHD